jgi:hypothetical protein
MAFRIQTRTIENVAEILRTLKVSFKIITENGEEYGDLEVVRAKRRARTEKYGHFSKYIQPFIENLQPGEVAQIPIQDYNRSRLGSSCSALACRLWGNGSNTFCTTDTHIELLRLK